MIAGIVAPAGIFGKWHRVPPLRPIRDLEGSCETKNNGELNARFLLPAPGPISGLLQ